jgi:YD repeat-containing protein
MTAYNAKGSGIAVEQQATKYLYTSAVNASWQTAVIYPDSVADSQAITSLTQSAGTATATVAAHGFSTGQWVCIHGADQVEYNGRVQITVVNADTFTYSVASTASSPASGTIVVYDDEVTTTYDRLGRTTETTDQRGVVHDYTFDAAGRLSADTATSLGSSGIVDGSVRRIGTTYDGVGRVQYVTSYSDTAGTAIVNQVKYVYNGWGKVSQEYQAHDGAVDGSTLHVDYTYDDGAVGNVAKYVRLKEVKYPNDRKVHYDYGTVGATDDIMSRLTSIYDDANANNAIDTGEDVYASYKYLGRGTIVEENYVKTETKLTYLDYSGNVTGLDRFGRVVDQVWRNYAGADTVDEYTYTYDRAGNRLTKANAQHTAFNETYTYDGLDRLLTTDRADGFDQDWTLDGLGNWSGFNDDGTSQTRTVNEANEIESTLGIATPTYDAAGNMTVIPSPTSGSPSHTESAKYDAWNHLVEVSDGGVLVAKFSYDGTGRRIKQLTSFVEGVPQTATHYYQNTNNQVLETRESSPSTAPESLSPKYQNVW